MWPQAEIDPEGVTPNNIILEVANGSSITNVYARFVIVDFVSGHDRMGSVVDMYPILGMA